MKIDIHRLPHAKALRRKVSTNARFFAPSRLCVRIFYFATNPGTVARVGKRGVLSCTSTPLSPTK